MLVDPYKAKQLADARTPGGTITPPLAEPRNPNPNWQQKAMIRKVMVFAGIVLLIVGGMPKLAGGITGMLVLLFVFVYFFVGIWGPSRYQQWKDRNVKGI